MFLRLPIAVLFIVPVTCGAATSTWEAFDYKNCKHWEITSDYAGRGKAFEKANEILQKLKQSGSSDNWYFLQGWKAYEENTTEYGICSFVPGSFTCHPSTEFVLAGTTFTRCRFSIGCSPEIREDEGSQILSTTLGVPDEQP
jgi:hypothetical protein